MPLLEGTVYLTPDGRRFRARIDKRQYGQHRSWTLVPVTRDEDGNEDSGLSRDVLERMLFLDHGHIVRLDFGTVTLVVDTGWMPADLRAEV